MDHRTLLARLFVPAAAVAVAAVLAQGWPKEQTVHYVLGDGAPRVEEVDARWASDKDARQDAWSREVSFHYEPGKAPRVVTHEPRLADGAYTVEVEIATNDARSTVTRHVVLGGGVTDIELARSVPR